MKTNCPKCSANLDFQSRRTLRCAHCGISLSYNALPAKLLLVLGGVVLLAVILSIITPSTSPLWTLQPVLISGLVILALVVGLKGWQLYRPRP
jgi:uncharacterized protein (DUF983 family)